MTHKRILVALGPGSGSDPAFERALALARRSGAELYLLQAVPADQPLSYRAVERRRRAAKLRTRAEAAGVPAQTAEQRGDAAEIIVLHADARPVDLIVMTSERRSGWARLRQRSVAERVLRRTKRPTLIVRSDDTAGASTFENVLAAVDLSPASNAVIETAVQLSGDDLRRLTVVHAVDNLETAGAVLSRARWMVPEYRAYVLDAARRELETAVPPVIGTDVKPHLRVAPGRAAATIETEAAEINADLIVVGRSKRFMHLGSTAVRILRHTDRALLVVPPHATAQAVTPDQSVNHRAA